LGKNPDDPTLAWKGDRVTTFLVYVSQTI